MKIKLSGYMISYNEKPIIKLSIMNLLQFVDELIITDGESTDGTAELLDRMANRFSKIKLYPMRQRYGRKRTVSGRERTADGFNEMERRTYAISKCSGTHILMKDVDELYHEHTDFHNLIEKNPAFLSFSQLQYEVVPGNKFLPHIRINGHHSVPRLIKNTPDIVFKDIRNLNGIDCCLFSNKYNKRLADIKDMVGAYSMWHYKMMFDKKQLYKHYKSKDRATKPLLTFPSEHNKFIDMGSLT